MKIYPDTETALNLWDLLDNESTSLFIPVVVAGTGDARNAIFLEGELQPDKSVYHFLRVFVSKEEADSYKKTRKIKTVVIAKTDMKYLLGTLEKNWRDVVDKKLDCVLSTVDMEGKFRTIETIWSNTKKPN